MKWFILNRQATHQVHASHVEASKHNERNRAQNKYLEYFWGNIQLLSLKVGLLFFKKQQIIGRKKAVKSEKWNVLLEHGKQHIHLNEIHHFGI